MFALIRKQHIIFRKRQKIILQNCIGKREMLPISSRKLCENTTNE